MREIVPIPAHTRSQRPRLHLVYYALATFDLLTVCLGLYLVNRVTKIYADSIVVNQVWADRLSDFADLSQLATAVNAPGNDVFQSHDANRESARLETTLALFNARVATVREDLVTNVEASEAANMLQAFDAIDLAVAEMVAEANLIFAYLQSDEPERAGRRMAEMDRDFARVNATLAELGGRVRTIQKMHFGDQSARAASMRRLEYVIAALVVLMVASVTLYGHLLARRMKETARQLARHRDHLEELVTERTSELESSQTQLRLAERLASIGTLAAGLGHDMNNLLFPVRCRLDALEAARLEPADRRELTALRRSVDYLQHLSDGLRLLALDPDDDQTSGTVTNLGPWMTETRPLLQTAVPRHASLVWSFPDDLPPVAVAPHRLTQALFNLVHNAGEAISTKGTIRVWGEASDDGRTVRVGVTDNGIGMTDDIRRRVLDPFFTTKKRRLSTGLGLALVHGVASSSGGTLQIDSAPGRGTTVTLSLPADRSEQGVSVRIETPRPMAMEAM